MKLTSSFFQFSTKILKKLMFLLLILLSAGFLYSAETAGIQVNLSQVNSSNNFIGVLVHGYPASIHDDPGEFGRSTGGYFQVPPYAENFIFGYDLSRHKDHGGDDYIREIGDFNNGSLRLEASYSNPQCHVSLAKCNWIYKKLFYEYTNTTGYSYQNINEDDREDFILILLKGDLRFVDLYVSPEHIESKLTNLINNYNNTKSANDFDINASLSNIGTTITQLANDLYQITQNNDCPNDVRMITHSMGGMFTLRYLTADPSGHLYQWYLDYTRTKFDEDIIDDTTGNYYTYIQDILTHMTTVMGLSNSEALDELYTILKEERQNDVKKALIQDGPLSGSKVAEYANDNFNDLKDILSKKDDFNQWKAGIIAGAVINIVLSGLEIWGGAKLVALGIPFLAYLGQQLITHGIICIIMDILITVALCGTSLKEKQSSSDPSETYNVINAFGNEVDIFPPYSDTGGGMSLNNFDVNEVKIMKELLPGSDFVESYSDADPPQYAASRDSNGTPIEYDNIQLHNITVSGVESISGGGYKMSHFKWLIGLGLLQTSLLFHALFYFMDANAVAGIIGAGLFTALADGIMLLSATSGFFANGILKIAGLIMGALYLYVSYIIASSVDPNFPHDLEVFHGLVYDLLGLHHHHGAALFCHKDSTGVTINREVKPIYNNSDAYVYHIRVSTKDHKKVMKKIGNNDPDRQRWKDEWDDEGSFIMCHEWSENTVFRPVSAIKDGHIFFNRYLFHKNNDDDSYTDDNHYNDVSQFKRSFEYLDKNYLHDSEEDSTITLDVSQQIILPEWDYLKTEDLESLEDRDLYHYFMFSFNNGNTPNNIAFRVNNSESETTLQTLTSSVSSVDFGNTFDTYESEDRYDRSINTIYYQKEIEGTVTNKKLETLNYIKFTNYIKVLPFNIYNYYKNMVFSYSINGEPFKDVTHIDDLSGYTTLEEYGEYMKDNENSTSSLVYDDNGDALLISPHFKEGFNSLFIKFEDPAGKVFYKDATIMQLTVPPFIKPVYPLMNQYINQGTFTAEVECLHIAEGITMPDDWFITAEYTIKLDDNDISSIVEIDEENRLLSFDCTGLSDGNHLIEFNVDYDGLENSQVWRFWVDTTEPQIDFPERIVFSNKDQLNNGGVFFNVSDTVPFEYGSLSYDVDTVHLTNLKADITDYNISLISKENTRLGIYSAPWNGWNGNTQLDHGIYNLSVEAIDRVGNTTNANKEIIIDNLAPAINTASLNTSLVNIDNGLLELTYNLTLDSWEDIGYVDVEVNNSNSDETFTLRTYADNEADDTFTINYYNQGINVLKDGVYDINVYSLDKLENISDPISFYNVVVDRTEPVIDNLYVNPFVVHSGENSIDLLFDVNEDNDVEVNLSSMLSVEINLEDQFGNVVPDFQVYTSTLSSTDSFEDTLIIPTDLEDGKYFIRTTITDKNGNSKIERTAFIINAIPPEITYPDENEKIKGIVTFYGNVSDPVWDNESSFYRYECYYQYGSHELPEDLNDLSSWYSQGFTVPGYQVNEEWPENYGRAIIEGDSIIGTLDTSGLENELITLLVIAVEESGYRIGTVRTFRILNDGQENNITVEIDQDYKDTSVDFHFTKSIYIPYTIDHSIDNPVDIYHVIKDQNNKIVLKQAYYNLKSLNINGRPDLLENSGVYIYQIDDKFYIHLYNDSDDSINFMAMVESNEEFTGIADADGNSIEDASASLVEDENQLVITKSLSTGEEYIVSFDATLSQELSITSTMGTNIADIYIGNDCFLSEDSQVTIYPGTNYPTLKWDGKNTLGRYVENGIYTVLIEAYGNLSGKGSDEADISITTPVSIENLRVYNKKILPGVDTADHCSISLDINKPSQVNAFVYSDEEIIYEIEPIELSESGTVLIEWDGKNEAGELAEEGNYEIKIECSAYDGSQVIILNKTNYPELGEIELSTLKELSTDLTVQLDTFDNSEEYNGEDLIQGDSKYKVVVTPDGKYLPDKEITMAAEAFGTQVVDAYPDLNYMAAFRTNFKELWAKLDLVHMKFKAYYKYDGNWNTDSKSTTQTNYTMYFGSTPDIEQKVVEYNVSNKSLKQYNIYTKVTYSGTVNLPGKVNVSTKKWSKILWGWFSSSVTKSAGFKDLYLDTGNASFFNANVEYGNAYMNNISISSYKIITHGSPSGSSYQDIPVTVEFYISCPVSISTGQYLSFCDGIAVMGPDILDSTPVYAHKTPFVNAVKDFEEVKLIDDPKISTGMTQAGNNVDVTELIWRKNPHYYFYYIGENYASTGGTDGLTSIDQVKQYFKTFSADNTGGGSAHTKEFSISALKANPEIPAGNYTNEYSSGKVKFIVRREGDQCYVKVESSASDRIVYPFPADVNKSSFSNEHQVGDSIYGIPITKINGERISKSDIPNYCVPVYKSGSTDFNVIFPEDAHNNVNLSSVLEYTDESGYLAEFDMISALEEVNEEHEAANIKHWEINEIYSENTTFKGIPSQIANTIANSEFQVKDSNIKAINDSDWTLDQDSNSDEIFMESERKEIDLDRLNRYGFLKEERISDVYLNNFEPEKAEKNMYIINDEGNTIDNNKIVIDPSIRDYSNNGIDSQYSLKIEGLDKEDYKGLQVKDTAYFGRGLKLSDGFILETNDEAPRKLVTVHGTGDGELTLSYYDEKYDWIDIPIYNSDTDSNIITYWDITGLNGKYTLRLISTKDDKYNVYFKDVYIGYLINTSEEDAVVSSPGGQAEIIFPEGCVTEDIVVNIDAIDMDDIKDVVSLPDIAPVGKVITLSPDGYEFDDVYPQLQFTYNKSEIEELNIDPLQLIIYHLSENGELAQLNTIKQLIKANYDENGSLINEEVIWDSSVDSDNGEIPDYTYVRAWSVTTHFSYYMVLEGDIEQMPVFDDDNYTTSSEKIDISGTALPGLDLELFIGNQRYYMKEENIEPVTVTTIDKNGIFAFSDIELPYEGNNYIFVRYKDWKNNLYARLIVERDTTGPELEISEYFYKISPDGNGYYDDLSLEIISNENIILQISINDETGINVFDQEITLVENNLTQWIYEGINNDGNLCPDGQYIINFNAVDPYDNPTVIQKPIIIDSTPPVISSDEITQEIISCKNQDGNFDETSIEFSFSELTDYSLSLTNESKIIKLADNKLNMISDIIVWNGKDNFGNYVTDGIYDVEIDVIDDAMNSASYVLNQKIEVDNTPPEVIIDTSNGNYYCIPGDVVINFDLAENGFIQYNLYDPDNNELYAGNDNYNEGTHQFSFTINDPAPDGIYVLKYMTKDSLLNISDEFEYEIELVHDITPPEIILEEDITFEAEGQYTAISLPDPVVMDDSPPITIENNALDLFPLGLTLVEWTARDKYGNESKKTQNVYVVDTTPPEFTVFPENMVVEATAIMTPIDPGMAEATDIFAVTITNDAPLTFPIGETSITWTATDSNGNESVYLQRISIIDTTPPELTIPGDIVTETTSVLTNLDIGEAEATDIFPVTITNDAPEIYQLGTTYVKWTAEDANGNITEKTQKILIAKCTLTCTKDTFIKNYQPHINEGANPHLIMHSTGENRFLVGFDLEGFRVDGIVSANLIFNVNNKNRHFGHKGSLLGAYRLLCDWEEGNGWFEYIFRKFPFFGTESGATWASPEDLKMGNYHVDGDRTWNGGSYLSEPTDTVLLTYNTGNKVNWNVLEDLKDGAYFGWIMKRIVKNHSHNYHNSFFNLFGCNQYNNTKSQNINSSIYSKNNTKHNNNKSNNYSYGLSFLGNNNKNNHNHNNSNNHNNNYYGNNCFGWIMNIFNYHYYQYSPEYDFYSKEGAEKYDNMDLAPVLILEYE